MPGAFEGSEQQTSRPSVRELQLRPPLTRRLLPACRTRCGWLPARPLPPCLPALQASIWEHNAVLTDGQLRAIDVISATCSKRPMPTQLAKGGGAAAATPDATPMPQTPLSPGSTDGAESSFAGTSFEDVMLQVGAGWLLAGCPEAARLL